MSTSLTVTTANICGLPLRPLPVVAARIAQACARRGVVFGQELAVTNPGYQAEFRATTCAHGLRPIGGSENLIAVPTRLADVAHETIRVHGGMPKVSPARYIAQVTGTLDGLPVAFLNCHPVSKPRRGVRASWWRIAKHALYLSLLSSQVHVLNAAGFTVVYGGDMNATLRKLAGWRAHPAQHLIASAGLDHLWIVPGPGVTFRVRRHPLIRRTRYMDHPIVSATLTLNRTTA